MASSLRPWVFVAVLFPGVFGCATLGGSRGGDTLTLRFAWPEQVSMRVAHTVDMQTTRRGRMTAQRRYMMTLGPVDPQGQRRLIPHDVEVSGSGLSALMDPVPTLIIDDHGAFRGIDPMDDSPGQDFLDALPLSPEKKAQVTAKVTAGLEQDAREKWNMWVGSWSGVRLKPGAEEVVETKMRVETGRRTHEQVPAEERTLLQVGIPCGDADPEPRCVRLRVVLEPVGQTPETTGRFARRELELVTDPTTLLPYSSRLIRMDRVDWNDKGGEPDYRESVQVEQHTFIYGAEAAAGQMARVPPRQPSPTWEK
ncbi:hypothetical protein [Corallococcus llansteffanensis]|uniref:Lipoprotein n=1 Tax=Corallococcus llansteffanensis TaxID=2316731 RepID=A0A3A8NX70_9BACT|nr:hypothetical protein [Corallococcus llansteffanensis]RKH45725.1 hypothetical protein D7V93_35275 [Corallococcus llansteffanensis]